MIPFVLFPGVVPGAVGYALHARLASRKTARLAAVATGLAAILHCPQLIEIQGGSS